MVILLRRIDTIVFPSCLQSLHVLRNQSVFILATEHRVLELQLPFFRQ